MLKIQLPLFLTLLLTGAATRAESAPHAVIPPEARSGIRDLDWAEEKGRRFDLTAKEAELERVMDHVKRDLEKERIGVAMQIANLRERVQSGDGESELEAETARARAETQRLKEAMAQGYFQYAKELGARADLRAEERTLRVSALRDRGRQYERVFRDLDRDLAAEQELARKAAQAHEPFGGDAVVKAEVAPAAAKAASEEPQEEDETGLPVEVSAAR